MTENATEHLVVIIDVGSKSISASSFRDGVTHKPKKSEINGVVMKKFWKACDEEFVLGLSPYNHGHLKMSKT